MGTESRKRIATALIGVAVLATAGLGYAYRELRPKVHTVEGTIVQLDPESRRATIEIRHPRTGQLIDVRGEVPADCEIHIDGQPASLADLKLGERARVQGTITVNGRITARWVRVHRTEQPTGPSLEPPGTPSMGAPTEASAPARSP